MDNKNSLNSISTKNRKNFFLLYSVAFLICAAICYFWFIIGKKTLIINSDGWRQHFAAFVYFGNWGREVLKTLVETHKLILPQWDFSIGLGSDILTTLHFYVIGDPLDLLSITCPARYAAYLYSFLSLLRLYLAGLVFGAFCFVKKQNNIMAIITGSLVYVFTLYGMFIVSHHPFFALPMIFLPLLLIGVEQIMAGKRPYLFVAAVFLSAISNFYFFYMLAIFTAFYTLFALIVRYRRRAKEALEIFFKIAGCAILGVVLSAIILLPVVMAFIGDGRSSESYIHTWIYDASYYRTFLSSMFSQTRLGYLTHLGYNAVALPAVCVLFLTKNKDYRVLRILFLGSTAMLLIPVFGWALNGFSYMANRWVWAYGMIIAFIVTATWQDLCNIKAKKGFAVIGMIAIYSLAAILPIGTGNKNIIISVIIALLIVTVCMLCSKRANKVIAPILAVLLVFASFGCNSAYFYGKSGSNHIERYVSYGSVNKKINHSSASKVKNAAKGDKSFYRFGGGKINYNEATYVGMNGTSFYWSMQNKNLAQLINETEQPDNAAYMFRGFSNSSAMLGITSVKYYAKSKNGATPYGFTKLSKNIYQNQNALPLGYTTDKVIAKADYDKLSSLEKQQALLQGVVLENVQTGMKQAVPQFDDESIDYTIVGNENAAIEGQKLYIYENNTKVKIQFSGSPNKETYLRFTLKDYSDYPAYTYYTTHQNDPLNRYSKEAWDKMSKKEKSSLKNDAKNFQLPQNLKLRFFAKTDDGKKYKANPIICYSDAYVRYTGEKTYLVGLGYTESAKNSITIKFNTKGIYDLKDIEVLEQGVDKVDTQIADFKADTLQNVDISANKISGTIDLKNKKALCLSIPYSRGWSATVDGKETEILQADTAFSAIILSPGKHNISLKYHTPFLKQGAALTALGTVAFITLIIVTEKKKKKSKAN